MAQQLQLRRGTTAQHATFTGAVGEVTVDTDKDTIVVHDGATAGGFPLPVNSTTSTHTAQTIELGHASDTTLSRSSAGVLAVEGVTVPLNGTGQTATFGTIELGHASDTSITRSAAGVVAVEGNVLRQAGKETIWIPAGAMIARTTNGAAAGTVESATNKVMLKTLDFDTTTIEYAQFHIQMPKSWNESTVTAEFTWTANSTSTNSVSWAIQGVSLSDDDAVDTAYGTAQQVSDANKSTAYDINRTAETSAITIAGTPAAEDWVSFQVYRDTNAALGGTDDLAADALLIGVTLYYTTDAANDA